MPAAPAARSAAPIIRRQRTIEAVLFGAAAVVVTLSAVLTKEAAVNARQVPALVAIEHAPAASITTPSITPAAFDARPAADAPESRAIDAPPALDPDTRWFDGRPVRPARTVTMTVTAYSPDEQSCGEFADGQTATLHSVWTNAMQLVAADTRVLPYGSMLTVPGYADDTIVPVLDCGGAIKGDRLDVLFPTHEAALQWGVRRVEVTVWEYADGKPAPNPRSVR